MSNINQQVFDPANIKRIVTFISPLIKFLTKGSTHNNPLIQNAFLLRDQQSERKP